MRSEMESAVGGKSSKLKIQNWLLILAIALVAFAAGGIVVGKARAETSQNYPPIVQKLVEKFGLKEEEVTGVFDELQQERQQKIRSQMESRLEEAVKDGVITSEQKQAWLDKQTEWQEKYRQLAEEMRQWRESNGIDFEKLAQYRVGLGGLGFGRNFGHGPRMGGF